MRTTIRMDDALLRRAREYAARSGKTLTRVIEDAVREHLARRLRREVREPVDLPTYGGQGLQPGIDLDDSAALVDEMEKGERAAD